MVAFGVGSNLLQNARVLRSPVGCGPWATIGRRKVDTAAPRHYSQSL